MREVSKRVFVALIEALKSADVAQEASHRLDSEVAALDDWATWEEWAGFLIRVEAATWRIGGLRRVGEFYAEVPSFSYLRRIFSFVASPQFQYAVAGRWIGNSLFPHVACDTVELGDGRLRQTLTIPGSMRDSPGFFDLMHGALVAGPRFIGLPGAHVEVERTPRRAEYTIVPPPSMSLPSRWLRSFRSVVTGGDHEAMRLFSHLLEIVQSGSRELERQRALVEARADALEAALRERDRLLAENERVTDQLAKARDELEYRLAEERADPLLAEVRLLAGDADQREVITQVVALLRELWSAR